MNKTTRTWTLLLFALLLAVAPAGTLLVIGWKRW